MTFLRPGDEESSALPNDERNYGVLLLMGDPKPMGALLATLRDEGVQVDTASDLAAARATFFGAGGHDCLVVGPDVRPGLAQKVASSLGTIDPSLAMVTFGPELQDARTSRTARLGGFHPGSRAGQGALLRFLRTL